MTKLTSTLLIITFMMALGCSSSDDNEMPPPQPEVNRPPSSFSLLEVPNNQTNITLKPELKWETANDPDGDIVTYDVLLDENNDNPSTIISSGTQMTNLSINVSLKFNVKYSWKVIARDSKGATTESEVFEFTTRDLNIEESTGDAGFEGREWFDIVNFNDRLWVVDGVMLGDIWSSIDGINWTEEVQVNSFSERFGHASVVFDGKIWIIGGSGFNGVLNDVWSSGDGVNWTQETANANFTKRYLHTVVVFKDKMWVIGGEDGTFENDEVWSSSDGINWDLESASSPFLARYGHSSVVFDDRIWVIGGLNSVQGSGVGELNDVWSSEDGVNWQAATLEANFSKRFNHSSVIHQDKIWVIAGSGGNGLNDIWTSSDGVNWKEETNNSAFPGRMGHASTVFNDKIWISGGWSTGSLLNDVWFIE